MECNNFKGVSIALFSPPFFVDELWMRLFGSWIGLCPLDKNDGGY